MDRQNSNAVWIMITAAVVVLTGGCPGDAQPSDRDGTVPRDHGSTLTEGSVTQDQGGLQPDTAGGKDSTTPAPDTVSWPDTFQPQPDTTPWPHDIGKACNTNADCMFNFCATNTHTGQKFCTKICDPCAPSPCPSGSGCQDAGLAYICAPGYPNAPCPNP
jgi:hypothetical protein